MRPYLAILKDAFREAVASRTLPFVLVCFTLVLLAIAPLGLREDVTWRVTLEDVADQTLLLAKLRQAAQEPAGSPERRVFDRLSDASKAQLGLSGEPPQTDAAGPAGMMLVVTAFNNDVLPDRSLYDPEAWENLPLSEEARLTAERGVEGLSDFEVKRFNRALVTSAFVGAIKSPPESRAAITYLGWEIPGLTGLIEQVLSDPTRVRQLLRALIYEICIWGIGPIGLLVAVIVTADVMPRTFEPGAADLLLSKPVRRAAVFLARFFGACMFVLLSFGYLVTGLWLIFWLRLGVATPQLLTAIPLFMFSFAVIYSVSAVTGVRWRSPVAAVLATVLVWGAAFGLGVTRDVFEGYRQTQRIRQVTPIGGAVVAAGFERDGFVWSEPLRDWQEQPGLIPEMSGEAASNPLMPPRLFGPVGDPKHGRVVTAELGFSGGNALHFASAEGGWKSESGAKLPPGTAAVGVDRTGRVSAAGQAGLYEFKGDPTASKKEFKIFGVLDLVPADAANAFVRVDPAGERWSDRASFAFDDAGDRVVGYDRGQVRVLARGEDGRFTKAAERRLFKEKNAPAAVPALAADCVFLAVKDGSVRALDAKTLKDAGTWRPFGDEMPRLAVASDDGRRVAVLYHGGDLALFDARGRKPISDGPDGGGDASAVAFDRDGRVYVAEGLREVAVYSGTDLKLERRLSGSLPTYEKIYRYVLTPIGYLLPDTYGLRSVYQYAFTDLKSESTTLADENLEERRITYELRRPVVQNALFLTVVLGLTCVYISRKDF